MSRHDITKEELREIFEYDKEYGVLVWKKRKDMTGQWNGRWAGRVAGSIIARKGSSAVYNAISVYDKKYTTRHLVWVFHYGNYDDKYRVASKDGDPMDCRIENLTLFDGTDIQKVRPEWSSRQGRYKGVYKKGNRYKAEITKAGKREYLGLFKTPREAAIAYNNAAIRLYGNGCFLNDVDGSKDIDYGIKSEDVF